MPSPSWLCLNFLKHASLVSLVSPSLPFPHWCVAPSSLGCSSTACDCGSLSALALFLDVLCLLWLFCASARYNVVPCAEVALFLDVLCLLWLFCASARYNVVPCAEAHLMTLTGHRLGDQRAVVSQWRCSHHLHQRQGWRRLTLMPLLWGMGPGRVAALAVADSSLLLAL